MVLFASIKKKGFFACFFLLLLAGLLLELAPAASAAELSPLDQWTQKKINFNCIAITYANDSFVAVGDKGKIMTSADGESWTEQKSETKATLNGVTYGNGTYAVSGFETIKSGKIKKTYIIILTSKDNGMKWDKHTIADDSMKTPYAVAFGNDTFVAVGSYGTIFTSTNGGSDWTYQKLMLNGKASELSLNEVIYAKGTFVVSGEDGTILTSSDGKNWTKQVSGVSSKAINSIIYAKDKFVAVGSFGTILTSPDAVTWTIQTLDTEHATDLLTEIAYGSDSFVVTDDSKSEILTSIDGVSWVSHDIGCSIQESFKGIAYGKQRFCILTNKYSRSCSFQTVVSEISLRYGSKQGGATMNITGSNLSDVKEVYFGEIKAPQVTLKSSTSMSVVTPASTVTGPVPLKVSGPEGTNIDCGNFTYADIVVSPSNLTVTSGQSATMTAAVDGIEPSYYLWKKNGKDLIPNDRITDTTSKSLTINKVQASDAGDYTCTACMDDGKGRVDYLKSEKVTLKVSPSSVALSPTEVSFDLENPSDVLCSIVSASGDKISSVLNTIKPLTSPKDYKMTGNTLRITKEYLSGLNLAENDMVNLTVNFDNGSTATLVVKAVKSYALTISAGPGGSIKDGSNGNYAPGQSISVSAKPATGYVFTKWTSTGGGTFASTTSADTTYVMPANAAAITANFTYTDSGNQHDHGHSGGGGGSTEKGQQITATLRGGSVKTEQSMPVSVNINAGSASVDLGAQLGSGEETVTVPTIAGVNQFTLGIQADSLSIVNGKDRISFYTGIGRMTIPKNMLENQKEVKGKKAEVSMGISEKSGLSDAVKKAIGDRPLIQLKLEVDGKQTDWNNPDAPVSISIPYKPTAEELENPESIVVWYIDGSGKVSSIPNGHYDTNTGMVAFRTTHFSYYAIGNHKVSFSDVSENAWYRQAVSFIAAREITKGTDYGTSYRPEAKLTRAEFLVMMMRAYGISPETNPTDNFADAGSAYYTDYLAAAKKLGISGGVGNQMFAPEKNITRQEMFTLLFNALKVVGELPEGKEGTALSAFSDAGEIDSWAKEAMTCFVASEAVGGSDGRLSPVGNTTRAEMAQVLYHLLSK